MACRCASQCQPYNIQGPLGSTRHWCYLKDDEDGTLRKRVGRSEGTCVLFDARDGDRRVHDVKVASEWDMKGKETKFYRDCRPRDDIHREVWTETTRGSVLNNNILPKLVDVIKIWR